jgi:hypothetical protein
MAEMAIAGGRCCILDGTAQSITLIAFALLISVTLGRATSTALMIKRPLPPAGPSKLT